MMAESDERELIYSSVCMCLQKEELVPQTPDE